MVRCFWAYEFGHQTSSTIVSSHSKLKQHPAYEFGHQTSSTVVSNHSKLKQHPAYKFGHQNSSTIVSIHSKLKQYPTNVTKHRYNENFTCTVLDWLCGQRLTKEGEFCILGTQFLFIEMMLICRNMCCILIFMNLRSLEVTWRMENQLCRILMKIVLNEIYFILVYDFYDYPSLA